MKVIKLNGRHNLYRRGFKYAFLFTDYKPSTPNAFTIERLVKQAEGAGWAYNNTFYGKRTEKYDRTPYYVGFHNPETEMLVKLSL